MEGWKEGKGLGGGGGLAEKQGKVRGKRIGDTCPLDSQFYAVRMTIFLSAVAVWVIRLRT